MNLMLEGYEIDIRAKAPGGKGKQMDTMVILNQVSLWASLAAERYEQLGCPTLAKGAQDASDNIYHFLESKGLYQGV